MDVFTFLLQDNLKERINIMSIFQLGVLNLGRVLATVTNSALNAVFPVLLIVELPNLCFPNAQWSPKM